METQPKKIITSFNFLRFIAIFLIYYTHITSTHVPLAACGVSFFVLLSGFLYGYVNISHTSAITLLKKKLIKFYPLHLAMFLVSLPLDKSYVTVSAIFKNLLLLQCYSDYGYFAFNGVSWYLSLTVFLSLLTVPLKKMITKLGSTNKTVLIGLFFLIIIINYIFAYTANFMGINLQYWLYICPFVRILEYTCGMIAGYVSSQTDFRPTKSFATTMELLTLLLVGCLVMIPNIPEYLYRNVIWILPLTLLIVVFSFEKGVLSQRFQAKPLVYLGSITFEFFMIHQIIIKYVDKYQLFSQTSFPLKFILVFILCLTASHIASSIFKRLKNYFEVYNL